MIIRNIFYTVLFFSLAIAQSYKVAGDRLYNSKVESVIFIDSDYGLGSGIIISEDGHVITNYHVIENLSSEDLYFYFYDGIQNYDDLIEESNAFEGEILYTNKFKDLALLKIDAFQGNISPIEFADPKSVSVGSQVFAIGHPTGDNNNPMLWSFTEGIINRIARDEWPIEEEGFWGWLTGEISYVVDVNTIFTQTPINSGNSGGLLMNTKGEMIGVNTWSDESMMNVSGAVNVDEVIAFIAESGINLDSKSSRKKGIQFDGETVFNIEEIVDPAVGAGFVYDTYLDGNKIEVELIMPKDDDEAVYILLDLNLDEVGNVMLYDIEDDGSFSYWEIDIDLDGYIDWEGDITKDKMKRKYTKFIAKIDELLIDNFTELDNQGFLE
tara:strand:+ start:5959 stop:7104 length:1146 start_codon:yes stop_codon:yes gene_type:complete